MRRHSLISLTLTLSFIAALSGCATDVDEGGRAGMYSEHAELSDLEWSGGAKMDGVGSSFVTNDIFSDSFLVDSQYLDANALQAFFEATPYGRRSWLADEKVNGRLVSEVLAETAVEVGVNPLVLVSRLQVESGLVSRTSRPSDRTISRAMGCGCFDGQSCQQQYAGFDKQIRCAARALGNRYDDSVAGVAEWQAGKTTRTLDNIRVTPANHATAALYAYTPWVLRGTGGTWLVWNVTKRYQDHLEETGLRAPAPRAPWVSSACDSDQDCAFQAEGQWGFCDHYELGGEVRGFCSLPCEGYCPDKDGEASTFCVALPGSQAGHCVVKAETKNHDCRDIAGAEATYATRFVGDSGAPEKTAEVCLP